MAAALSICLSHLESSPPPVCIQGELPREKKVFLQKLQVLYL